MELDLAYRGEILCSEQEQTSSAEAPIHTVIEYSHNHNLEKNNQIIIKFTWQVIIDNQMSMMYR